MRGRLRSFYSPYIYIYTQRERKTFSIFPILWQLMYDTGTTKIEVYFTFAFSFESTIFIAPTPDFKAHQPCWTH